MISGLKWPCYHPVMRWLILLILALPFPASAAEVTHGPVPAAVVSVYDGDTLTVDASPWPGFTVRTSVRIDGIDTPEIRGKCDAEKALAVQARDRLRALAGSTVQLTDIRLGASMPGGSWRP